LPQKAIVKVNNVRGIIAARRQGRMICQELGFNDIDQARIVTAISEIASHICEQAKEGTVYIESVEEADRIGLKVRIEDILPSVPDLYKLIKEDTTSNSGISNGLMNGKLLMDDFTIHIQPGKGTTIHLIKWKLP
jgi:serine/threonine-protein kinase RsbT